MVRISLSNVNALANDEKKIESIFEGNLYRYKKYVKNTFCPHIKFEPNLALDLVYLDGYQYIGFNSSVVFKTFCDLLNIQYSEDLDEQSKFEYYNLQYSVRIEELKRIKDENDLCMKFYRIYDLYQERKEKTNEALSTYYTCAQLFPMSEAITTRKKRLYRAKMTEEEYYILLSESYMFNLPNFIQIVAKELDFMVRYLPVLINSLTSLSIPTTNIKNLDLKKFESIIEQASLNEASNSYGGR